MQDIFIQDILTAQARSVPIIIPAITFCAGRNYLSESILVEQVNQMSIDFIVALKKAYSSEEAPVLTTAPLGSMYDAYCVEKIPLIEEAKHYHQEQISILKKTDIDFIEGITLPSLNEALGIALVLQETEKEYLMGFVLDENGLLLDGSTLDAAIATIDEATQKQLPLGYMVYCAHPSIFEKLQPSPLLSSRLIGLKANASSLALSKLDSLVEARADEPETFAASLAGLKKKFGLKILGGCCGTSINHLESILEECV